MRHRGVGTSLLTLAFAALPFATAAAAAPGEHGDAATAWAFLRAIQAESTAYALGHEAAFFQGLAAGQHPRATLLACSDSRVQTDLLDRTPEGDLFVVRDIGNQVATARGSLEYGINHLASSLLLVLGHSSCGAIQAAAGDYSGLEPDIRRELDSLKVARGASNIDGVLENVHFQVARALELFADKVRAGHLLVVGAVFDFADDMHAGTGRLNIVDINGEADPAKIRQLLAAGVGAPAPEPRTGPADRR